jgi:hypothetical protein
MLVPQVYGVHGDCERYQEGECKAQEQQRERGAAELHVSETQTNGFHLFFSKAARLMAVRLRYSILTPPLRYSMLKDSDVVAAKKCVAVLIDSYKKVGAARDAAAAAAAAKHPLFLQGIWNDARTVNVIAQAQLPPHTSHLTPHTSHLTPHTSHLTPHTSHLTPHTSHLTHTPQATHTKDTGLRISTINFFLGMHSPSRRCACARPLQRRGCHHLPPWLTRRRQ